MTTQDVMPYAMGAGFVASVCAILGVLWKMLSALLGLRDDFRDIATKIGQKHPPEGLLGDMQEVKDKQDETAKKLDAHEVKLAVIEANVAQRRTTDKKG